MAGQQDQDNNKGLALIFIALAILLVAAVLYLDKDSKNSAVAGSAPTDPNFQSQKKRDALEKAVNKHIQMTNRKIETDKEKIRQEAIFTIPRVGQIIISNPGTATQFDMRGDRNELNSARDLKRDRVNAPSAGDIIHSEMAENEARKLQNEQYMKDYAKEFIENARRNGYEVELGADYSVKNVRRINPSQGDDNGVGNGAAFR